MNNTRKIITTALLTAVVFISTSIGTALPFSGYIHLGDAAVYLSGLLLGPYYGFAAAAAGSALADSMAGFFIYIPSTVILKGLMAYITGKARNNSKKRKAINMFLAGIIMICGYYMTEVLVYGNPIAPLANMPFNVLQFAIGIVIALSLWHTLKNFRI